MLFYALTENFHTEITKYCNSACDSRSDYRSTIFQKRENVRYLKIQDINSRKSLQYDHSKSSSTSVVQGSIKTILKSVCCEINK